MPLLQHQPVRRVGEGAAQGEGCACASPLTSTCEAANADTWWFGGRAIAIAVVVAMGVGWHEDVTCTDLLYQALVGRERWGGGNRAVMEV